MIRGYNFLCALLGLCVMPIWPTHSSNHEMETIFEWSQIEYEYPSPQARKDDIDEGNFEPGKPAPIDVDVYYSEDNKNNKVFLTTPRFQDGVPATLGMVLTNKKVNGGYLLRPYPSWDWHTDPHRCKKNRLISVYRVMIDECDRMWVLDNGNLADVQICQPQVLAFDLKTNKLVHRHEIPWSLLDNKSLPVTLVTDIRDRSGKCRDTVVYAADCQSFGIIVHDTKSGKSWKAVDKTMYPDPSYGTYDILGDQWDLMDGVLGMAISPYTPGGDRKLFYHAMSSGTENWVYTSYLRNSSLWENDGSLKPQLFNTYPYKRDTQVAAEAIDSQGIMFFGLHKEVNLICWNTATEYKRQNFEVIADDKKRLQFASGVKVIKNKNKKGAEELWVMTSRFNKIATGTLNPHETNFRVLAGKIDRLVAGTQCDSGSLHFPSGPGYGYGFHNQRPKY